MQADNTENTKLLNEILLTPSAVVIENRFKTETPEAAGCSGVCPNGCRYVHMTDEIEIIY